MEQKIGNNIIFLIIGLKNKNSFYLYIGQFVNYIFLFFLIFYITKYIGIEYLGKYMFAFSFIQYFSIFIDFGFNFTVTKSISINRLQKNKLSYYFFYTLWAKILLLFLSLFLYLLLLNLIPKVNNDKYFFLSMFGVVIAQTLTPLFFFLGVENLKLFTIIYSVSRFLALILIVIFVKNAESFNLLPLILSICLIAAAILSIFYAIYAYKLKIFLKVKVPSIIKLLKESLNVFLGNSASSLYLTSNSFILGLIAPSYKYVGYYSIAEKVIRISRYVIAPYTQAIFPKFSQKFSTQSKEESIKDIFYLIKKLLPILFLLWFFTIIISPIIIYVLNGKFIFDIFFDILIISPILLIGTMNNIMGVLGLINLNLYKLYRNLIFWTGFANVTFAILLGYFFYDKGVSFALTLSELVFLILLLKYLQRESNLA